jgi:hypothetical protein
VILIVGRSEHGSHQDGHVLGKIVLLPWAAA